MKKLLALLLALMMTVCVFAACSEKEEASKDDNEEVTQKDEDKSKDGKKDEAKDEEDKKKEKKANDEDVVEDVVNNFVEAAFTGDDAAFDYVAEDSDAYSETEEIIEMFDQLGSLAKEMGVPEEYAEDINAIVEDFADAMFSIVECEVTSVEVDGDEATADITLTAPDFENFDSIMGNIDIEEILMEEFTEEELAELENASEEEQVEAAMRVVEVIFDAMVEELEGTTVEQDDTFTLEKIDGEWLIVA